MNKKTAIYIGGAILLAGVGFFIYKKRKAKANYNMGSLPNSSGQGSTYSDNSSSSSSSSSSCGGGGFDPKPYAEALKDAMGGMGTDDDKFWDTSSSISKSERREVRTYFETNIGDLKDWIEGDFSFGDEKKALRLYGY